jgi:uncharacterized protein
MRITEVSYEYGLPIKGYGVGFFRIGSDIKWGNLFTFNNQVNSWSGFNDTNLIVNAHSEIDVLLVGTGVKRSEIPATFRNSIEAAGVGVETMSTPIACRTYNVLLGEGRRIGAALLAI